MEHAKDGTCDVTKFRPERCLFELRLAPTTTTTTTTTKLLYYISTTSGADNGVTSTTSSSGSVLDDTTTIMSVLDDQKPERCWFELFDASAGTCCCSSRTFGWKVRDQPCIYTLQVYNSELRTPTEAGSDICLDGKR